MMRPNQNDIKNVCLTVFFSYYFKPAKVENDYQLNCLTDDATLIDSLTNFDCSSTLTIINLMKTFLQKIMHMISYFFIIIF